MALTDLPEFTVLAGYAKALAHQRGADVLLPAHLLAGAWIALHKGLFAESPTLEAHLKAHQGAIKASLVQAGLVDELDAIQKPLDAQTQLKLHEDTKGMIVAAKSSGSKESEQIIHLLSQLLMPGIKLNARESTAYHEAGHAVVSLVLRPEARIGEVSVESKGNAAGYTSYSMIDSMSRQEDFLEDLCVAMAGQVAQIRKYGPAGADAGALSDFAKATKVAWHYITKLGLDNSFGPVVLDVLKDESGISSGWLFDEAQCRLQVILKESMATTRELVHAHWEKIEKIAELVLERGVITEDEIRSIVSF